MGDYDAPAFPLLPHVPSLTSGRAKPDTRRTLLSRRDSLTERERTEKSRAICERARAWIAGHSPALVALYANKGSEVETTSLDEGLRAAGFRIAYPRVIENERVLAFCEVGVSELVSSRWGLREPAADAPRVAIDLIDAFVLPGLAFDREGGRIGWGMGHYDATLAIARADALRVGLAFECQVVERVPREAHDAVLGAIITEVATHVVA